jgi:hypothetical protein
MKRGRASKVIAILKPLMEHKTLLMLADLAAGAAGRHYHGHEAGHRSADSGAAAGLKHFRIAATEPWLF